MYPQKTSETRLLYYPYNFDKNINAGFLFFNCNLSFLSNSQVHLCVILVILRIYYFNFILFIISIVQISHILQILHLCAEKKKGFIIVVGIYMFQIAFVFIFRTEKASLCQQKSDRQLKKNQKRRLFPNLISTGKW